MVVSTICSHLHQLAGQNFEEVYVRMMTRAMIMQHATTGKRDALQAEQALN